MPPYTETSSEAIAERHREKDVAQNRLRGCVPIAGDPRTHQAAVRVQRHAGRCRIASTAARAARGAGLPAVVLANRVARDQLPPLLRHQHSGRAARGRRRCVRGDSPAARAADPRAACHRRANRPSRRAVRSGALFREAAGSRRRRLGHGATVAAASPALRRRREDSVRPRTAAGAAGRCTARPATTSSTRSTGCSSTPAQRAAHAQGLRQADRRDRERSTICCTRASG